MRCLFLFTICLFVGCQMAFGQLVYKTEYEKALELTGIVFKTEDTQCGTLVSKHTTGTPNIPIVVKLNTYRQHESNIVIRDIEFCFGKGNIKSGYHVNCSEINEIIHAIDIIKEDNSLSYIVNTGNILITGDATGKVKLLLPLEKSKPGDFVFGGGYIVDAIELMQVLRKVMTDVASN